MSHLISHFSYLSIIPYPLSLIRYLLSVICYLPVAYSRRNASTGSSFAARLAG